MKCQQKTVRNISWLFNAQAVIQRFLLEFSFFLTLHEASVKTVRILSRLFNAQNVIQHFLLELIFFLIFHEASAKPVRNLSWLFNAQAVIHFLLEFIFFYFYEASAKKCKKYFVAFQYPGCDTTFPSKVLFGLDFS